MNLFAIFAWSFAYATEFIVILDVLRVYPYFPFCNHCRSGSKNIMNRYGIRVLPWIVLLCIGIFCV